MQQRDNFVRFARGLLADPAIVPLLSEGTKKILAETIDKIAGATYSEIREQVGAKVGPMRLFLSKSAGDFSVTFEDVVKLLLHQDAPLEIYRLLLFLQVNRLSDFNKVMLYLNFFVEAFGH